MSAVRAAVDLQDETLAAPPAGTHEPGIELVPVTMAHRMQLRLAAVRCEPAAAVAGEPPQVPVLDHVHVAGPAVHARDRRDPAASGREPRTDRVLALHEPFDGAVESQPVGNAAAAVGHGDDDVLLVE